MKGIVFCFVTKFAKIPANSTLFIKSFCIVNKAVDLQYNTTLLRDFLINKVVELQPNTIL
jgi:hypothetical protein